ncbi:MAG: hypothetical protein JWM86_2129, partial [Thermoleophilia bacterium]|nr:hypothetical protein [Thermoleophilia bacterium]
MSATIASCCTPCAAAPVQQPTVQGGGAPMKDVTGGGDVSTTVAPDPVESTDPAAGAQPSAPADVSGGGASSAATCYDAAPEPTQCGQWVPAPVATGDVAPTTVPGAGTDGPPEPIAGPDPSTQPSGPAGGPASMLATWPQWQQQFTQLGVSPEEVAKLGAAPLSDAQLAKVYEQVYTDVVKAGGTPGQPISTVPASTWSPAWEQRFAALGLPAAFITELRAEAERTGADDAQLGKVYQQLVQSTQQGGAPTKPGAGTPGPQGPQGPGKPGAGQQPQASGPGWNPQVEQAFRGLGMPDEVIALYAQSGAPLTGLEAAYKHAAGRVEDFTKRGWMKKFDDAKVPALQKWTAILGDQPAKDADLEKILAAHKKGQQTIWQKGGQLATSLVPGGRLAQFLWGKEVVSGEKIDRTSPMEIGMAALSGLALFATIRGAKTIGTGWTARSGGYLELNSVNGTLGKLGLPATGAASMEQAAMGATQTWGLKQKLISLIPGTQLHKEVVGLGHAEAAARAFNNGGAASLLKAPDGKLQLATLSKVFDDIKTGTTRIQGGALAYLGPFKKSAPMVLDVKKGQEIIHVAKNLRMGNGTSQLVSLAEVGGAKLGTDPRWLSNAANLGDDVAALAKAERDSLGRVMGGSAARTLAEQLGKDGARPMRYIAGLQRAAQPQWYGNLAKLTANQWPAGAMSDELLELLAGHRVYGTVFAEAAPAIKALDRSALGAGVGDLVDDASRSMDEARTALDAAKAAGKVDTATAAAVDRFTDSVSRLEAADPSIAKQLFPTFVDDTKLAVAHAEAIDAVQVAHAAEYAAKAGTGVADDAAKLADDAAKVATDVPAVTTADVSEGAVIAQPNRQVAMGEQLELPFDVPATAPRAAAAPATTGPAGA